MWNGFEFVNERQMVKCMRVGTCVCELRNNVFEWVFNYIGSEHLDLDLYGVSLYNDFS